MVRTPKHNIPKEPVFVHSPYPSAIQQNALLLHSGRLYTRPVVVQHLTSVLCCDWSRNKTYISYPAAVRNISHWHFVLTHIHTSLHKQVAASGDDSSRSVLTLQLDGSKRLARNTSNMSCKTYSSVLIAHKLHESDVTKWVKTGRLCE